ncbi:Epoxide hydrolase EphG [Mycobacteroides salmoniphilum]|uniref:Epoxide hydrolase EphG n=1 Tax=Mycobacteroides salmoniphilum TaxID=404941 RepID=A0A4R8RY51_9MYCO|nr:limonene-1,2-epoxide hydrolase family protein [Mycobacteroides salmoniphilum]TDZ79390.1 Epoxide hydrolase EphG [Mycobacteroides salmoniphilum]
MSPREIVERALTAMVYDDPTTAIGLMADDIVYTNVGLPTVHGKSATAWIFSLLDRPALGFNVKLLNVTADGNVVMTERIDELRLGRMRTQFWAFGRFVVVDGKITVWRDYFDFVNVTIGIVKALVSLVFPRFVTPLP